MKNLSSLAEFTIRYIFGIIIGATGFAFVIMDILKVSFLESLYSSSWNSIFFSIFMIIGIGGVIIANTAGWSKNFKFGGIAHMERKLTKENKKILKKFLTEAKEQKKTIQRGIDTYINQKNQLEEFIGIPIELIDAMIESYRQHLSKLEEHIKILEEELKK